MSGKKKIVILIAILVFISGLLLFWFYLSQQRKAAILIETIPESIVSIDGQEVGRTPYEGEFPVEEVAVKLIPVSTEAALIPYETKVSLTSGVKTIVRRMFGEKEEESSGEEISYERIGGGNANISVISIPDGVSVFIDGQFKDVTPVKINNLNIGTHEIKVKAEDYEERSFSVQVTKGYNLTAIVDLARKKEEGEKELEVSPILKVKILSTPTGFLRVRDEPNKDASETGRVKPDENYNLVEKDSSGQWYEIELEEGKTGWISSEYATVSSEESN